MPDFSPKPALRDPAHVQPYVEAHVVPFFRALGEKEAVRFLLYFGGTQIYLAATNAGRSEAARLFGTAAVAALVNELGSGIVKVPLARRAIARWQREQGMETTAIARLIRADVATVRKWRAHEEQKAAQLSLFDRKPSARRRG